MAEEGKLNGSFQMLYEKIKGDMDEIKGDIKRVEGKVDKHTEILNDHSKKFDEVTSVLHNHKAVIETLCGGFGNITKFIEQADARIRKPDND